MVELSEPTRRALANLSVRMLGRSISPSFLNKQSAVDNAEGQLQLLEQLSKLKIDPQLFDLMLSNGLDRQLKQTFGIAFYAATLAFTIASYTVVVLNSVYKWGVSEVAITSLIIETPIQFIGLLYIIARNLFPQSDVRHFGDGDSDAAAQDQPSAAPKGKAD